MASRPSTTVRLLAVLGLMGSVWAVLELLVHALFSVRPTFGLHLALSTIAFEMASGTLALWLARGAQTPPRLAARPAVSVLVAAYNEALGIVETVRSIRAQEGVLLEVIIADDGSIDGTADLLKRAFALSASGTAGRLQSDDGSLTVLRLPHAGKGTALNEAVAAARYPVVLTVDADTALAPWAIARLVAGFDEPSVVAATGSVLVANTPNLLTRFQQIEYVRNTVIRVAWAGISALEQLPGAFMAVRAEWVRAVGGYPVHSLTEDYELVYRLYDRAAQTGLPFQVAAVPTACAYTEAPTTLGPLMRQRTRWFAGFLNTLFRFRHLIGQRSAGVFGVIKLPIKLIDAVHPMFSLLSLLILIVDSQSFVLRPLALSLFGLRWFWDSLTLALAVRFARKVGAQVDLGRAHSAWPWLFVLADGVSYFWLRQVAVLRAYLWAIHPPLHWNPVPRAPALAETSLR